MSVKILLCALALVALCALHVQAEEPEIEQHSTQLTTENFDALVKNGNKKPWLVKFFAPWCKHCQALAPTWEEAAKKLKKKMNFAKIDCTEHKPLCSRFGVDGYPQVKLFRDGGENVKDYKGPRNVPTFQAFADRLAAPAIKVVESEAEWTALAKKHPVTFVLTGDSTDSDITKTFTAVAEEHYDWNRFAKVTDKKVLQKIGMKPNSVGVVREGETTVFDGVVEFDELEAWMRAHRFILVPAIDGYNFKDLSRAVKYTAIAIIKKGDPTGLLPVMKNVAREMQGRVSFGWIDGVEWKRFIEEYDIRASTLPRILVVDDELEYYLPSPKDLALTEGGIGSLVQGILDGTVPMNYGFITGAKKILYDYWVYILVVFVMLIGLPILVICCTDDGESHRQSATTRKSAEVAEKPDKQD